MRLLRLVQIMRWLLFAVCFFVGILICFWIYVWSFRAEFVQTGIERSCPHYRVALGSVDRIDRRTWVIRHLAFTDTSNPEKPAILIPECTVSSPLVAWLRWFILPTRAPLYIETVTMIFSKTAPFTLTPPQLFTGLWIGKLTAVWPDGSSSVFTNLRGGVPEIMQEIQNQRPHD